MQTGSLAIVCGSSGAVGGALVARLHSAGITVIAVEQQGFLPHPNATYALTGDLTAEADWQRFAADIRASWPAPSLLACALDASDSPTPLLDLAQREWDAVLNQNLRASYLACKLLFPLMRAPAAVVLSASTLGDADTRPDAAALAASAAGILALARTLALTGAQFGIRANAVCYDAPLPAAWNNNAALSRRALERIPLGRATTPADVVDAMMFLLSDDASYLTGSSLRVDGGQSLQSWSNAPG